MFSMIDESKCDGENYLTKSFWLLRRISSTFIAKRIARSMQASKREVIDNV